MNRFRLFVAAVLLSALFMPKTVSADSRTVIINEVQTGTSASASQEFIELYNAGADPVDMAGWTLQYRAASGTGSWYKKADITGSIDVGGFYLLATTGYLQPDQVMSSGLAASGGTLRLADKTGQAVDLLGWGTAAQSETSPAPAPPAGQSLERTIMVDTDNNLADFAVNQYPDPTGSDGVSQGAPPPDPTSDLSEPTAATVNITELLVNPIGSDATDEFIELHNASAVDADLSGDKLQSGSGFKDSYTMPTGTTIAAGRYLVLYAKQTHLSLTNSGGAARLVDANGSLIDQTDTYDTASQGQSWSLFTDGWQWTTAVTPGADNILVLPLSVEGPTTAGKTTTASTKTAKPAAIKPAKPAKAAQPKASKAPKSTKTDSALLAAATDSPQSRWLLIAALALTIGYTIYEFRYDIRNYYVLARRKLGAGREDRPAA